MTPAEPARLVLELSHPGAIPTGKLCTPQHPPIPFEGWLQLLAALQQALDELSQPGTAATQPTSPQTNSTQPPR